MSFAVIKFPVLFTNSVLRALGDVLLVAMFLAGWKVKFVDCVLFIPESCFFRFSLC